MSNPHKIIFMAKGKKRDASRIVKPYKIKVNNESLFKDLLKERLNKIVYFIEHKMFKQAEELLYSLPQKTYDYLLGKGFNEIVNYIFDNLEKYHLSPFKQQTMGSTEMVHIVNSPRYANVCKVNNTTFNMPYFFATGLVRKG